MLFRVGSEPAPLYVNWTPLAFVMSVATLYGNLFLRFMLFPSLLTASWELLFLSVTDIYLRSAATLSRDDRVGLFLLETVLFGGGLSAFLRIALAARL